MRKAKRHVMIVRVWQGQKYSRRVGPHGWLTCQEAAADRRDHLLINVLWQTGARISDFLGLHVRDLDPFNHLLTVRPLKTRKKKSRPAHRVIPVSAGLSAELSGYLVQAGLVERIFPISRQRAYQLLRLTAARAGLPVAVHPHLLRHSFAVHSLASGVPITVLKDPLGHASVLTTMVYLTIVQQDAQTLLSHVRF